MAAEVEHQDEKAPAKRPNKIQPGVTRKKLPWLDGKSSIASSPLVSPPGHASTPKRKESVSPLSREATSAVMDIASESHGGPSNAVKWVRESHVRRPSVARSVPTPMGQPEPKKRLSIVHIDEPEVFFDIRSRADSLAPVPHHLERDESPDSVLRSVQRVVHASPPNIIQTVQRSPNQPVPRPSVFERYSHRRLSNAIEGLEDLVEEAVATAERTERPENVEQIYAIIEDANIAVQDTSSEPARHLMRTSSPLQVTTEEVSQFSSELSVHPKHTPSNTQVRNVEQRGSETMDWAYRNAKDCKQHHQHFQSPSSSSSSSASSISSRSRDRRRSCSSSGSDLLRLLPPQPIATASRDHVDHVLRPKISRSHSRGRSCRRRGSAGHCQRRHQQRRSWRSDDTRSHSSRRHLQHHRSSDFDTSFDEEDLHAVREQEVIRRYGEELHVRDAHHHTFSLRRNHRRQPVARNWQTGKKRICAIIACANTAVLGIVVGIYASASFSSYPSELTITRLERFLEFSMCWQTRTTV
jgi:hypothetical protein